MTWEYSEDNLIEQTAINLFYERLGWNTAVAYNKETFGEESTLGRLNKREVILKRNFFSMLTELNPNLPTETYTKAYDKLIEGHNNKITS